MYSLSSGDIAYILPMDHIDLTFLRRHEQIGDSVKPLWSPRQEEYTEFQLKAWRRTTNEEEDEEQSEDEKMTTMCHICDTQVPVVYIKKHNNSKKHKNFLNIIDEALSRLRCSVNMDSPTVSTREPSKSTYFCEACCKSVLTNNKEIHDRSKNHKRSQNHDKKIEKLLKALKKNCTNMDGNSGYLSNDHIRVPFSPVEVQNPKKQDSKVTTPLEQLKKYINAITNKVTPDPVDITVLDENYIVMNVKSCYKIHIDNFNGFVEVDKDVQCLLCQVVVKSKSDHIWTGQHMRWIMWHLADEHCIRRVNQDYSHCIICNELIRSVGGHRVLDSNHAHRLKIALCNTMNSSTCLQTQRSMKNAEEATATRLDNDEIVEQDLKLGNNIEMSTEDTETKYVHYIVAQHAPEAIQLTSAQNMEVGKIPSVIYIQSSVSEKSQQGSTDSAIQLSTFTNIKSEIPEMQSLNTEAPSEAKDIQPKVDTIQPDEKINQPSTSGIIKYEVTELKNILNQMSSLDIKSSSLLNKISALESIQRSSQTQSVEVVKIKLHYHMKETSDPMQLLCKVCNKRVPNTTDNIVLHINGKIHNTKYKDLLELNEVIQVESNFHCNKCNVHITKKNEIYHILGNKHKHTFSDDDKSSIISDARSDYSNSLKVISNTTCHQTERLMRNAEEAAAIQLDSEIIKENDLKPNGETIETETENTETKYVHYLINRNDSSRKGAICRICDRVIPDFKINIEGHMNGRSHKKIYNDLLTKNHMSKVPNGFACEFCRVHVPYMTELEHVSSDNHMRRMNAGVTPNQAYCELCMVYIDSNNLEHHRNGRKHKQKALQSSANDIAKSNLIDICKTYAMATNSAQDTSLSETALVAIVAHHAPEAIPITTAQNMEVVNISSSAINIQYSVSERSQQGLNTDTAIQLSTFTNIKSEIPEMQSLNTEAPSEAKDIQPKVDTIQPDEKINQPSTSGIIKYEVTELKNILNQMSSLDIKSSSLLNKISALESIQRSSQTQSVEVVKIKLHYHMKETSDPMQLLCKVCNKRVPNTTDNIVLHINGKIHNTKYKDLLELNEVIQVESNFHCNKCNVHITKKNEIYHILGNKHKHTFSDDDKSSIISDARSDYSNSLKVISNTTCHQTQRLMRNAEEAAAIQLDSEIIKENDLKPNGETIETETENTETKYVHYLINRNDSSRKGAICRICDRVIPDFKINIEGHMNGRSHKKIYNDLLTKNHMSKVPNGFACEFCRVHVPYMTELEHVSRDNHMRRMNAGVTPNQAYCELCMVYIDSNNLEHHRNGRKHKQKALQSSANDIAKSNLIDICKTYAMATNSAQDTSLSETALVAIVAHHAPEAIPITTAQNMEVVNISSSAINIQYSVSERSQQGLNTDTAIQLSTFTNIKSEIPEMQSLNTEAPSEAKDIQPKVDIIQSDEKINQPSTSGIIKYEVSELKNILKQMSSLDIKSSSLLNKISALKSIQRSSQTQSVEVIKIKLHYHMKETSDPMQLLCKVCNKRVPNTTDSIALHINGKIHNTKYKDLLELNEVIQVESNFHCNKCNVHISKKNEINHILGNKHKHTFSDDKSSISSDTSTNSDDSVSNANEKPSRTKKFQEYKSKLYLFDENINSREVICRVCRTELQKSVDNVNIHAKETSHLTKYNALLKLHRVVKSKNSFLCNVCDESIARQSELDHICSTTHLLKLLGIPGDDYSSSP